MVEKVLATVTQAAGQPPVPGVLGGVVERVAPATQGVLGVTHNVAEHADVAVVSVAGLVTPAGSNVTLSLR